MLTGIINSYGLSISYEQLLNKYGEKSKLQKILKTFTVIENSKSKPKGSPLLVKYAYLHIKDRIIFPRIKKDIFIKHNIINDIVIEFNIIPRIILKHKLEIPLYDYQQNIVSHLQNNNFKNNEGICYLQMDTGLGKTRIGCALINAIGYAALIVVPTIAIGYQWIDEFTKLLPLTKILFYNKRSNINDYDVVIIVVNSFHKKDVMFLQGFGIIIYDEAHEYYTRCNGKILWLAQTKVVLGLSATPLDRPDGLDRYVTLHLGNPIYANEITDIDDINFKATVKCINYFGDPKYTETVLSEQGIISSILTIGNIIKDPTRISIIVRETKRLYSDGYGIFIFAEHRNFLDILKDKLIEENISENEILTDYNEVSILRGGVTKIELNDIKNKGAHIVLTTYGYSRRGISLIDMTSLILTSPRRNGIKQIIGRIFRKGSDESIIREIIDIVDIGTVLKSQYNDRKKIYKERKYEIVTTNESYINTNKQDIPIDNNCTINDLQSIFDSIYK